MNRFLDFLTNSKASALLVIAGAIALVLFAIPPLHGAAWVIGVLLVGVIALGVWLVYRRYQADQARIDQLHADLAAERERGRQVTEELGSYRPLPDESSPDVRAAREIMAQLPSSGGVIGYLRIVPELTAWGADAVDPLSDFLSAQRQRSFSDPAVHRAFMDLYRAGQQLRAWFQDEGTVDEDGWILTPADQRPGGWREYAEAKSRGESQGDELRTARSTFQRIALERGALRS